MKRVPLIRRDGSIRDWAVVDEQDYADIARFDWHLNAVSHRTELAGYAVRTTPGGAVGMHRQILGLKSGDGLEADHINRNTLDNRRRNLRVVSHAQNMQNRKVHRHSRSQFRGVEFRSERPGSSRPWRARVRSNGQEIRSPYFATELEAALAAERLRKEHLPFAQPDPQLAKALSPQGAAA